MKTAFTVLHTMENAPTCWWWEHSTFKQQTMGLCQKVTFRSYKNVSRCHKISVAYRASGFSSFTADQWIIFLMREILTCPHVECWRHFISISAVSKITLTKCFIGCYTFAEEYGKPCISTATCIVDSDVERYNGILGEIPGSIEVQNHLW